MAEETAQTTAETTASTTETAAATDADKGRYFTKDEYNESVARQVTQRLAREREKYADYEDLKAKAEKLDKIEAANLSEIERERAAREKAEADAKAAIDLAQKKLTDASILAAAAGKLADPTDAVHLVDRTTLEFDGDGNATNVADAISSLLEAKPHLAAGAGGTRGDADQGARTQGDANQLTRDALKTMSPDEIAKALEEGRLKNLTGA